MNDLLQRISSYNLFNYLLPGVVFVALSARVTRHSFVQPDLLLAAFVYYFIGLVISRFGSLVIEPTFKWLRVVRFVDYRDFVSACKQDDKIELLSEANNTYRTLCATFVLLGLLMSYDWLTNTWPLLRARTPVLVALALILLFAASYRKQTAYVRKRVEAAGSGVIRP